MQLDKDVKERIIAFTSKRLSDTQVKWGVTSKESAALIHCMKKFRAYVHGHPTVCLTDHKALLSVLSGNEFATERLNRMSLELMEYDIHLCYRPGKLLDLADLMSRARIEQDPEKRETMVTELIEWRARQEMKKIEDENTHALMQKKLKPDDKVGESGIVTDMPPHLQSPAQRAMGGEFGEDPYQEYDQDQLQHHMNLLVRGATVDMEDIDSCQSAVKKVEQITRDMAEDTYECDLD